MAAMTRAASRSGGTLIGGEGAAIGIDDKKENQVLLLSLGVG
jgi:hypothetical protein